MYVIEQQVQGLPSCCRVAEILCQSSGSMARRAGDLEHVANCSLPLLRPSPHPCAFAVSQPRSQVNPPERQHGLACGRIFWARVGGAGTAAESQSKNCAPSG